MKQEDLENYGAVRERGSAYFIEQKRGLIGIWGREAVQFLNGLVTNDVAKLDGGGQMLAAYPNAKGRLLALVRLLRRGDKFLFETEATTYGKMYQNLFRFTFAGDFFVEELAANYRFFQTTSPKLPTADGEQIEFRTSFGTDVFVRAEAAENFKNELQSQDAIEVSDELYEVLRVEQGIPVYGIDMDETTIVPELGLENLISYDKGCYTGQEIIARIHFRGHVAKQLRGLMLEDSAVSSEDAASDLPGAELETPDGKNAGRITSAVFSPKLGKAIALGYVRFDYLAEGTELKIGERAATVKNLPFIG